MRAIVADRYGSPDVLRVDEVEQPSVGPDGVLVRVRAVSLNPYDWHVLRGSPYVIRLGGGLRAPKQRVLGVDLAGEVAAVGAEVTELRPGDEVFGARSGAMAEYVLGAVRNFVPKPARISFDQAAAIPVAAITALQALRDRAALQAGQRVLVNGAAGGVGTFAVQIAKALGAEVTGVCSASNAELVRSIGADDVVDYTTEDFSRSGRRYDVVVDNVANRSLAALRRALTPEGTLVIVGGGRGDVVGPFLLPLKAFVVGPFVGQRLLPFYAKIVRDDLLYLADLVEAGTITPVVERSYPFDEAAEAIRHLETLHARGKIVITF